MSGWFEDSLGIQGMGDRVRKRAEHLGPDPTEGDVKREIQQLIKFIGGITQSTIDDMMREAMAIPLDAAMQRCSRGMVVCILFCKGRPRINYRP